MAEMEHPRVVLAAPVWSLNGPNIFSATLARGLGERNIPAHIVLTRPDWYDPKPLPRPVGVQVQTLPVPRFASLRMRWKIMRRYLEEQSPCIYIPNHDFGHSCIGPRLPASVAVVGIAHSDDPQHYEHVRGLGRYWNAVVAVSSTIAEGILETNPELAPRLSVIPYGVASADALPLRPDAPGQPLRVVYAGRLDQPQKRVLDLALIAKAAADLGVPLHLRIAGSGPAQSRLHAGLLAIGPRVRFEFLGTLGREALMRELAESDVFLLVSEFEGLPLGVLEAMGQGCIPVVSDVRSGVRELIENGGNGFRVAVGDIGGFASRLQQLAGDPKLRKRLSEAAYISLKAGPSREAHMVESYVQLFSQVLADVRTGAFRRPAGRIEPPPGIPWPERLPGPIQRAGHYVKGFAAERRS